MFFLFEVSSFPLFLSVKKPISFQVGFSKVTGKYKLMFLIQSSDTFAIFTAPLKKPKATLGSKATVMLSFLYPDMSSANPIMFQQHFCCFKKLQVWT